LTGDPKYESAVEAISQKVHSLLLEDPTPNSGLVPIFINANTGKFRASATITLGARGDSYYEYLLKQWVQTGKTQNYLKEDFLKSVTDVSNQNWLLHSLRF
jgi:mannosyl-oligosaccharide alpha-1,2-mannosidase